MSEEGATRRSTRSLTRRQSTETPSPPPLGGTPAKRARSTRVALLSSIAETGSAGNVVKAVDENIENNQESSKQRSSSLTTVDSPKPKRGGRRSLLTEDAVASLEPVRRSRRLSTSSEVSIDVTEEASRSSTPVKGVTRRSRRLSVDSEDSSNAPATRAHTVSALPVVEAIQEEELNILSSNDFLSSSKNTSIVGQFAVTTDPSDDDVIIIETESFGPSLNTSSDKSTKPDITPVESKLSPKLSISDNSNSVCKSFTVKSSPDPTQDTSIKTSQLKQNEKDISTEQAKNLPPVEQLKSKTPTNSCEIEITVTDPTNRTKSITDVADLDEPVFNDASPVAQLKSTKACKVHITRHDISDINGKITEVNNSGNQKLGSSSDDQEEGKINAAAAKETTKEESSDKIVLTDFQNNVDGDTSDCGSTLQLTIDTSSSLIADSNISDNVGKESGTPLNTVEVKELPLTTEQVHKGSPEGEKINKSPESAKSLHPQTLSNNDVNLDKSLHQASPRKYNLSVSSEKDLDKSLSGSDDQITKEEQNKSVTLKNDLNVEKKINEKFVANTSATTKIEELNSSDVSMKEILEENNTKATEEKLNTSADAEKELNTSAAYEKELNVSAVSRNSLNTSAVSKKELNASAVPEKELNASAGSEKELNVSAISEKGLNTSAGSEKELNASAISEKGLNASAASEKGLNTSAGSEKELNASAISEKGLNASAASEKGLNTCAGSEKGLNTSARSEKGLNTSARSEKGLNTSAGSEKGLNTSAGSEKELNASAISEKGLNASTASEKGLNTSAGSEKKLNASIVSEKGLNVSSVSEKELNTSTVSEKGLNASAISEKGLNASVISEKELNASNVSETGLNVSSVFERELNSSASSEKELNSSIVSEKELNASSVSEKELNASDASENELNISSGSKRKSNKFTLPKKELNVSILSEKVQNISSHDKELNVASEMVKSVTELNKSAVISESHPPASKQRLSVSLNSTEQLNVSNVTKSLNLSTGCDKILNASADSKNVVENSTEKLEDEKLGDSTNKENKNKTKVSSPEKLNKSQNLVEDKETSSLVISDDSDIESESNAKEYLKLNSDSDSSDYVDKEAKDMGKGYESHDSMDDDERDAERENKFLEAGESIESSDNEQLDDDYEHDSFCVESRSEDEELLEGDSEDLDSRSSSGLSDLSQSQAAKEKYNSRRSKKRMSVILDSSSDILEDGKDLTLRIESDDENESENIPKDIGSKIPAKDLPKTLSEAVEEIKQLKNIPQSESGSSDISEDMNIKNQYEKVLKELNSQHQKEEDQKEEEKDLDTSKGTPKKSTSPKSLNESNSIQREKENSPSKNSTIVSPTKSAVDNNETDQLNSNASVESKSPSQLANDISNKETNKPSVDTTKEAICIDESESESGDLKSNASENIQGSSGLQKEKSKNPMKNKLKENKIDLNKIDLNKIQAACEQIMQKEIEKKRIRRESENESNTKKQTKALRGESTKKLKRLPEATLKELDEIESTSETISKLGKDIKEKTQTVTKQEKNIKEKKTSPTLSNNLKRLPEKTLEELMDSEDETVEQALPNSNEKETDVQIKKTPVEKSTKMFNNTGLKQKENKTSAQSKKALPGTTLSEISNTNKKSNKAPIKKKFKQQENIPKATTYFEVASIKNEKKRPLPPPAGTGFQVKRIKTKTVETSVEGCTTIFKIESRRKINLKDVLSTVVSNETTNFKQNSLSRSKVQRIEKGLIEARKNKQKALASRK